MNNRIYQSPDLYTVLSNRLVSDLRCHVVLRLNVTCQLTSLYSLQSTLDILREHRPDYTPRTGFVWPITDPLASEDPNKKRGAEDELPNPDDQRDITAHQGKGKASALLGAPKKQQNTMLLLNAMRTTAIHSNMSFTSAFSSGAENALPETPSAQALRSSTTPVPGGSQGATPKGPISAPTPQEAHPVRAPAGAGKKKKKRK
jgi:mediator of RNA polymerase II transcription subunit 6